MSNLMKINGSGLNATLLWENPNANVAFGKQTISIKNIVENYDYICVAIKKSATDNTVGKVVLEVRSIAVKNINGTEQRFIPIGSLSSDSSVREFRFLTKENNVIVENQNNYYHRETNNSLDIPFAIYGIKGSIQGIK